MIFNFFPHWVQLQLIIFSAPQLPIPTSAHTAFSKRFIGGTNCFSKFQTNEVKREEETVNRRIQTVDKKLLRLCVYYSQLLSMNYARLWLKKKSEWKDRRAKNYMTATEWSLSLKE